LGRYCKTFYKRKKLRVTDQGKERNLSELSVVMLSVIMLNVVAPSMQLALVYITWLKQMPIQRLSLILNISIKILFTILYWLDTTLYLLSQQILSQLY